MLIAGVDDAGRGSAIGSLVIAGVLMKEQDLAKLAELGVKDSKVLTRLKREMLASEIEQIAHDFAIERLLPREIDDAVLNGRKFHKLNWLEAKGMARIIEKLKPDKAYVDASDVLEERFKQQILENLALKIPIVSEHKADQTYPVVSAASIIAKVERDREAAELANTYGDFGSGYPSDPKTRDFLKKYVEKMNEYPEFVRKSWKPVRKARMDRESRQTRLM